jgi:hypothetical protein
MAALGEPVRLERGKCCEFPDQDGWRGLGSVVSLEERRGGPGSGSQLVARLGAGRRQRRDMSLGGGRLGSLTDSQTLPQLTRSAPRHSSSLQPGHICRHMMHIHFSVGTEDAAFSSL